MDFSDVTRLLKEDLLKVDKAIKENCKSDVSSIPSMSHYLMGGGGKRIRPLLLLLSAKLCGSNTPPAVIDHCCALEYVHTATLLHDDVVDQTTVRRGLQTINSKWGSDTSILLGDYLLARAIDLLAQGYAPRVNRAVADAAKILVEGGIMEIANARKLDVTEELLLDIVSRKTASLMTLACQLGALLSEADAEAEAALAAFGKNFGIAFQLVDDALDYDGSEEVLGKPAGADFKEGHVTLPLFHLYQNGDRPLRKEIEGFINNKSLTKKDLEYVIDRMRESKSIDYTVEKARAHMDHAKTAVKSAKFAAPEFSEALVATADYIIDRIDRQTLSKTCA